jgi:hypothetical protein
MRLSEIQITAIKVGVGIGILFLLTVINIGLLYPQIINALIISAIMCVSFMMIVLLPIYIINRCERNAQDKEFTINSIDRSSDLANHTLNGNHIPLPVMVTRGGRLVSIPQQNVTLPNMEGLLTLSEFLQVEVPREDSYSPSPIL